MQNQAPSLQPAIGLEELKANQPGTERAHRSGFAGDVLKLISGTGSAQIIGVIAAPLIARMFSPGDFGVVALYAGVTNIIGVLVCLRYEFAILLPREDEDAVRPAWLCFVLTCVISGLTLTLVVTAGGTIGRWTHAASLQEYLWLLPVSVFGTGMMAILNSWNTRKRNFGRLTVLQVVSRCCTTGLQLAAGFAGLASGGVLIISSFIGSLGIPVVILSWLTWRDAARVFASGLCWQSIPQALRRYRRFPEYNTFSALLNTFAGQAPVFLLSGFFSAPMAGQYSMGSRLLRVPMGLIGASFSRAFFPRAAAARHAGTLRQRVETGIHYLIAMTMLPCLVLTVTGKDIFLVAFGRQWTEAGIFAQIMGPWLFFWFLVTPLNNVLLVLEEQALELRLQTLLFITRILSLVAGGLLLESARTGILLLSGSGVLVYAFYSTTLLKKAGVASTWLWRTLATKLLSLAPAGVLIVAVKLAGVAPVYVTAAAVLILVAYYFNLLRGSPTVRRLLSDLTQRRAPADSASGA